MNKKEFVYYYILENALKGIHKFTQIQIHKSGGLSIGLISKTLNELADLGIVDIHSRFFLLNDIRKLFYFWATHRKLKEDILLEVKLNKSVKEIESNMIPSAVFTAYTAYKLKFNDVPADYSKIIVYVNKEDIKSLKKRFSIDNKTKYADKQGTTLIALLKPAFVKHISISLMFVDLWNLPEWNAYEFLKALERRLFHG